MVDVVSIKFKSCGKVYYFDPNGTSPKEGDRVVVETANGRELAICSQGVHAVADDRVIQPLQPVVRVATAADLRVLELNKKREAEAFEICKKKIAEHELDMKLVDVECNFDGNKITFFFTSDGRVDFRELVKDLAAVFRTRIELRQIGVRDETKILGGIGICGRPLCCKTYLSDFVPVSIKMAKEQSLSLNPTKISGVCGRLMCCLKNEQETYEYLNSRLPSVGDTVMTKDGAKGEVQSVSVLRQLVKVVIDNGDEKELREYKAEELSFRSKRRKDVKITEEELKELQALEEVGSVEATEPQKENRSRDNRKNRGNRDNSGNRENDENSENRENRGNRGKRDNRSNQEKRDTREKQELSQEEPMEVRETASQEEPKTNGEGNHRKKRYDGKKRHFNRNKKRKDHNQAE